MTLFLIPKIDDNFIITFLMKEKIREFDKIIIYQTFTDKESMNVGKFSEILENMKVEILVQNKTLSKYLSEIGVKEIKYSQIFHSDLNEMTRLIMKHILENSDTEEEIKVSIPPIFFGNPMIYVALTLSGSVVRERMKLIQI